MNAIAERIRRVAVSEDIPVLGLGPCDGMSTEPVGYRPEDVLPGARGMVGFGIPLPSGVMGATAHAVETIWRAQNLWYRRLDSISLRIAQILEESGARSLPIYGCYPMTVNGNGDVAGFVSLVRMGVLLGMGAIGQNGMLLNTAYGARLILGGVLTTVDLPSISIPGTRELGCPTDCRVCVDSCPARALSAGSKRVDIMRCLVRASRTPFMPRWLFALRRKGRPQAAARLMNYRAFDEHTIQVCSRCVSSCPYGTAA